MELVTIDILKNSPSFAQDIRWDVTPKIFMESSSGPGSDPVDITYGYMLYVDLMFDKPALIIMQLKRVVSKSVGYVTDIPEELLKEAMNCTGPECVSGMYPLTGSLQEWLKKELGVS
jgi:hypothetical protein